MRAVAVTADGALEVVERPDPVPGRRDVVVAVERCGICGSDLHLRSSGLLPAGTVLGHEFAGTVAAAGEEAGDLPEGRRVAVLPARRCGRCEACRAGRSHLCPRQVVTAIGLGVNDGAYAEYVRVPATSCFPLPEGMTPEQGALVEPFAVGLHAVARSRASRAPGLAVAVVGGGPIGLTTLAALRLAGVGPVAVAEPNARRAAVAAAMGAAVVADAGQLGGALGQAPEVVFDAAGTPATPVAALEAVRPGGQLVLLGALAPGEVVAMPALVWLVKEVDVVPSMAYTEEEFAEAVTHVAAGAVDPGLVVSEVRPLEDAERSFAELAGAGGPVKLMLTPER